MKKFTLTITLLSLISLQSFSQDSGDRVRQRMTKGELMNSHVSVKGALARAVNPTVNSIYTDDFSQANDTIGLTARGYLCYYRGTGPQDTATWLQGDPLAYAAFNGADSEYVSGRYNCVTATNDIDNWLVLPALNISSGDIMSFYSQGFPNGTFPDSIKVMYSASGDSTPEGTSWVQLGDFKANTAGVWQQSFYAAPSAGATARFAIRYAVVNGGPAGANSEYIGIDQIEVATPAAADAGVSAITGLPAGCGLNAAAPVGITINNYGGSAITGFDVSFTVNGGTPVTETFTGSVPALGSVNYTFTGTANLSTVGSYTIKSYTSLTGDSNAANDTATATLSLASGTSLASPLTMGFEAGEDLSLWSVEDVNGDAVTWEIGAPIGTYPHYGTQCMRKPGSGGGAIPEDDDWLYTPCLELTAGTNYVLEYWYKNFELVNPCSIETAIGTAATAGSMTQSIIQNPVPGDTSYQHVTTLFNVTTSGTHYIGFHAYVPAGLGGSSSIRIDDVNIAVFTGVAQNANTAALSIYPNPTSGIATITNPAVENTLMTVYNVIGEKVFVQQISAPKTTVDLSTLSNGVYVVKFESAKNSFAQKLTINK